MPEIGSMTTDCGEDQQENTGIKAVRTRIARKRVKESPPGPRKASFQEFMCTTSKSADIKPAKEVGNKRHRSRSTLATSSQSIASIRWQAPPAAQVGALVTGTDAASCLPGNTDEGLNVYQYVSLRAGRLLRRYKRFLADVEFDGEDATGTGPHTIVVHCPNTGPMKGLLDRPNAPVYCSVSANPKRKFAHTLEMIQPEEQGTWVGVHSAKANAMVLELLQQHAIPGLPPYDHIQAEATYASNCRVDFLLTQGGGSNVYVEVKSVTLAEDLQAEHADSEAVLQGSVGSANGSDPLPSTRIALFPDTVSVRAQRHMESLMKMVEQGHQAACIFVMQRGDCVAFAPCYAKDPKYAALVAQAHMMGVMLIAVACELVPRDKVVCARRFVPVHVSYKL